MKILFESWFRRKMDCGGYMYAITIIPTITIFKEPVFWSISIQFLFFTLTIDKDIYK